MEPLIEENAKLKEAVNLMEKNIQRAQHEWDLAESDAKDLEYQKGVLSEQLASMSDHALRCLRECRLLLWHHRLLRPRLRCGVGNSSIHL